MGRTDTTDDREPRGRLLFSRSVVLTFLSNNGLRPVGLEAELPPYIGVANLARLLSVSQSWLRALHRRGLLQGEYLKPPLDGEAA